MTNIALFMGKTSPLRPFNQKIDKIKSRLKDGELNITAYTDKDIVLIKRQFDISAKFFEEVFGIKTYLNKAVK